MATKWVRIKPYDARRRHVLRSYLHGPSGKRFEEKRGWYQVAEPVAKYLARVHQLESDTDSPLAFDVCTHEEAKAIDAREKVAVQRRAGADEANDLTTSELGENRARARAVEREARAAPPKVPKGQRGIRRGVRDPRERSMRPAAEDERA